MEEITCKERTDTHHPSIYFEMYICFPIYAQYLMNIEHKFILFLAIIIIGNTSLIYVLTFYLNLPFKSLKDEGTEQKEKHTGEQH